jgi:hypothetical protein
MKILHPSQKFKLRVRAITAVSTRCQFFTFLVVMSTLPEFISDPTLTIVANFRRLAIQEGWTKKSKSYKEGRRTFFAEAVETGFISQFGANANSLQAWQSLCRTIGFENASLTSIKSCQKVRAGFVVDERFTDRPIDPQRNICQPC